MYRTLKWFNELKDTPLEFPICVPTYSRPISGMTKVLEKCPELPVVFFIRREQKDMYKHLCSKARIVLLDNMENIGQTRYAIVEWAQNHGYDNIFMFDDRVNAVNFLAPHTTRSGRLTLAKPKECKSMADGLRIWEHLVKQYDLAVSGASHSGFSWSPSYIDAAPFRNRKECQIAIHLNVKKLKLANVQYRDCKECGSEDAALSFDAMTAGLRYLVFTDLEYNNIPSSNKNGGGIQETEGNNDRIERFDNFNRLFMKNVCGEGHPGISTRKAEGGVHYIKFNWSYWKGIEERIYES